jgi:SAM-dependent methyltransferase
MQKAYDENRFKSNSKQRLAQIILTGATEERWLKETPIFAKKIVQQLNIDENSTILDFGVGIGRLAKEVIELTNCTVIGVDISQDMLRESIEYVSHPNYIPMRVDAFAKMQKEGKLKIDAAYTVWVLQHCLDFEDVYGLILDALPKGAPFFIANTVRRWIPVEGDKHWSDDGLDIRERILDDFKLKHDLSTEMLEYLPEGYEGHFFCHGLEKSK